MHVFRIAVALLAILVCSLATANENRLAEVKDMLAQALYAKNPGENLEELMSSGLSRADSEKILSRLNGPIAQCMIDAIREYSSEMSLDFGEQIDLLEADLREGIAGNYFASLDQETLKRNLYPCVLVAYQSVGLQGPNLDD